MPLLTRDAPHVVRVQKRSLTRDEGGRPVWTNDGEPVSHRCAVQVARDWSSAEETSGQIGLQVLDMRLVISKEWSGDVHSHIFWEDEVYEMIGAPQHLQMSPRTSHWRITMRRLGDA